MERATPGRVPMAPVPQTPQARRESETPSSRLPVRTPQARTPRASLLPLENLENIPRDAHLPRHKTAEEVARLAEARLDELRKEKHALQNEREDLRTEIRTSPISHRTGTPARAEASRTDREAGRDDHSVQGARGAHEQSAAPAARV